MCNEFNLASINTGLFPISVWVQGSLLGSLLESQAEGANSLPQVWHSIGPRLASLARFRDPSEATFALFGNLRHSSGSVFAHLRIPIGHYRDTERQHEALPFPSGQLGPSTIKLSWALEGNFRAWQLKNQITRFGPAA